MERVATFLSRAGERLSLWTLLTVTATLPLVFMPGGKEAFRTPKEIVFHIGALLLAAFLTLWSVRDGFGEIFTGFPKPYAVVISLVLVWTTVTTFVSSNRLISVFALGHVLLAIVWFLGAWATGRRLGRVVLIPAAAAGVVSAGVAVLQATHLWSPVMVDVTGRASVIGLMGNPNDVGGLIALTAIPIALFAISGGPRTRVACGLALAAIGWAIFVTESGSAAASLIAGLVAIPLARARRDRTLASLGTALLILALAMPLLTTGRILTDKVVPLLEKRFAVMLSGRIIAYATATRMVQTHPLTGVGPGCFEWAYPPQQMLAFARNPDIAPEMRWGMFAEVHNDHLEIAAETGVPGLVLELAGFFFLFAGVSRTDVRREIGLPELGRLGAWGLGAALFVQMTFNFPVQISGILATALLLAGVFTAWQSR